VDRFLGLAARVSDRLDQKGSVLFEGNAKINGVSWLTYSIDMTDNGGPGGNVESVQKT